MISSNLMTMLAMQKNKLVTALIDHRIYDKVSEKTAEEVLSLLLEANNKLREEE